MPSGNSIKHSQTAKGGAFYYEKDGKKLAEMVYLNSGDHLMVIEHTDVDSSLQGQGIGTKLLENLVSYVRENHIRVIPLCPFARATFEKTPEWQDVLSPVKIKPKN